MAHLLKPYSDEWFCALDKRNPSMGRIARLVIKVAGHDHVCYVCGLRASHDYVIPGKQLDEGVPLTARLCACCALREKAEVLKAD